MNARFVGYQWVNNGCSIPVRYAIFNTSSGIYIQPAYSTEQMWLQVSDGKMKPQQAEEISEQNRKGTEEQTR